MKQIGKLKYQDSMISENDGCEDEVGHLDGGNGLKWHEYYTTRGHSLCLMWHYIDLRKIFYDLWK